jgi:hypothetical protein
VFVAGYARALARIGRHELQDHLDSSSATPVPFASSLEFPDENTPPEEYPPARITLPMTSVNVGGAQVTVTASMTVYGDYGLQTITPLMTHVEDAMGWSASDFQPVQDFKDNPQSRISTWNMSTVISVEAPQECGLRAEASTAHEAWWNLLPAPRLPLSMMPEWMRLGRTNTGSSGSSDQPSCSGAGGPGGGGNDGGGQLMGHYVCYSRDWYDGDGNYLFTIFEGCYLQYTYWLEE